MIAHHRADFPLVSLAFCKLSFNANKLWFTKALKCLCQVTYNIPAATLAQEDLIVSPVDKTKKYMLVEGKVEIVLRNADLDFRVLFKGKLAGHCIVKYMENLGAGSSE